MGQDISKSLSPPPLSLQDCIVDGRIDLTRYFFITRQLDEQQKELEIYFNSLQNKKRKFDDTVIDNVIKKGPKKRSIKKHKLLARMPDGTIRELKPEDTIWYYLYVSNPPRNECMKVLFRNRFRVPYEYFLDLSQELMTHELFERWTCKDATGLTPSNFKLLL